MGIEDRKRKISSSELFAAIFFELTEALSDRLSSIHLLEAANSLVKLIEDDFGVDDEDKYRSYSNYYSHDTFSAIRDRQWQIMCTECRDEEDVMSDDPLSLESQLRRAGYCHV